MKSFIKASTDFETEFPVSVSLNEFTQFQCTSLRLLDDSIPEGTEELIIGLTLVDLDLAGQVTISPNQATITIEDNDDFNGTLDKTVRSYTVNNVCCDASPI